MDKAVFSHGNRNVNSPHQLPDRAAPGDELEGAVETVFELQIGRDAEAVVDGGDDVGGEKRAAAGMGADFIGGAVDVAAANAPAGGNDAVAEGNGVVAGTGAALGCG